MSPTTLLRTLARLALGAWIAACAGCATHGVLLNEVTERVNATLENGPTQLLPGDTIALSFPENEDWAQSVVVRPDGKASFAFVGELEVAGLSVPELEARLRKAYGESLPGHEELVSVTQLAPRLVFVMGEVHKPGEIPIQGRMTLIEALALAGGPLKETALLENTLLIRWSWTKHAQHAWRIDAAVEHWETSQPLLLQPHDVIFVPNTPIDDVDIWVDQYIRRLIPFPYIVPPLY